MTRNIAIDAKCDSSAVSVTKRPRTSPKSPSAAGSRKQTSCAPTPGSNIASETAARMGTGANEVVLPWPPRELHPNSRVHWAKKAKAVKLYRLVCCKLAKLAKLSAPADGPIRIGIVFVPPDRRRRDIDGMLSAIKSGLDGLADAMGVDDHRFTLAIGVAERVGTGGVVRVMVG